MVKKELKVAIVHDDFIQHGGAERLVSAMLKIWPQADLFSVIVSGGWFKEIKREVRTTWIQKLPFKEKFFRYYYSLYPLAVESYNFDGYDVVISSSARYAHGILTKPRTLHVAYINSPARFLWEKDLIPKNPLADLIIGWHQVWDKVAAFRPDYLIANSKTPAARIEKYWGRKPDAIIYPFVDLEKHDSSFLRGEYFLIIARLNKWKRVDIAIETFNRLKIPLYVIGNGPEFNNLRKRAGNHVKFLGFVDEGEKYKYLKSCQALVVTQEEDFGIVSLEANACSKPVIAYGEGGSVELIKNGINGILFKDQTAESLAEAVVKFRKAEFSPVSCRKVAEAFSEQRFCRELERFVRERF